MRRWKLYRFMVAQHLRNPVIRAFFIVSGVSLVWLAMTRTVPQAKLMADLCYVFIPVYFVVATGGSIIEKMDRPTMEMILAKSYTRKDIVMADYLSAVSVAVGASFALSGGISVVYLVRLGEGLGLFAGLWVSLVIGYALLYSFVMASGVAVRNAAVVVVIWVGYIYFGMAMMEAAAAWMPVHGTTVQRMIFYPMFYVLPRLFGIYRSVLGIGGNSSVDVVPLLSSGISSMIVLWGVVAYVNRRDVI